MMAIFLLFVEQEWIWKDKEIRILLG